MQIGNKLIGGKPYIIAECGVNHNGSLERAKQLIVAAAKAGADAVKFQTYTADDLVVKGTPKFWDWKGDADKKDQHEAYTALSNFPLTNYPELIKCCEENNIEFLSTPFSFEAATYLDSIGMKAFKIASSDMSTIPFLEHIGRFNKPILLSTGASTLEEIHQAVNAIEDTGNRQIIIMHCTLCYPTADEDANLEMIHTLEEEFPNYIIGISDHTLGPKPAIVAASFGARVIEKHFTVDKRLKVSADHWLSVNPKELAQIVSISKDLTLLRMFIEQQTNEYLFTLNGSNEKRVFECESETRKFDKRSIVSKVPILKDTVITEKMLTYKRPGTGIWPAETRFVIGKKALSDINADTTLTWEMIA